MEFIGDILERVCNTIIPAYTGFQLSEKQRTLKTGQFIYVKNL